MVFRDLIFDLGLFDGSDTAFYLAKGFRVVAVEARPDLCALARERFSAALENKTLKIVEGAIWRSSGDRIPFYIRSGQSSVFREIAERDGCDSVNVEVRTTTISKLISKFGVPHYLKCDIEGAESFVIDGLLDLRAQPTFVSFEDATGETTARLTTLGYDRFQMVNQGRLHRTKLPRPAREGVFCDVKFDGNSSGPFGFELDTAYWSDAETLRNRMQVWHAIRTGNVNPLFGYACKRWGKLTRRGWLIPTGWADVHATTAAALVAGLIGEKR